MITRKQYITGKASHREYYGQFVTEGVLVSVKNRFGKALLLSKDPFFNDIPLKAWDDLAELLRPVLGGRIARANESGGVSLSDLVCTVKEAAQQIRDAETV